MNANPYDEPAPRTRRTRRMIIEYSLHVPIPADQPALPFEPAQPAQGELTIEARFQEFHRSNPHVYTLLRNLALTKLAQGAHVIRTKQLFEELRAGGVAVNMEDGFQPYKLNNVFTSHYARLLDQEPGLAGRIPMRAIKSE
jgi:hypothetical protein